jgi:hypothetical protein
VGVGIGEKAGTGVNVGYSVTVGMAVGKLGVQVGGKVIGAAVGGCETTLGPQEASRRNAISHRLFLITVYISRE